VVKADNMTPRSKQMWIIMSAEPDPTDESVTLITRLDDGGIFNEEIQFK
jgi:hypothetical protein